MGNNMIQTALTFGEKHTKFISDLYNLIENNKIEEGIVFHSTHDSLNSSDYYLANVMKVLLKQWNAIKIPAFIRIKKL